MKLSIVTFLILAGSLIMFCLPLSAQSTDITTCEPCLGDSAARVFQAPDTAYVGGVVGSCTARIVFQKRKCDYCWDVKILSVEFVHPACDPFIAPDSVTPTAEQQSRMQYILTIAMGRFVHDNMMELPPDAGTSDISCWRIMKPQCLTMYCVTGGYYLVAPSHRGKSGKKKEFLLGLGPDPDPRDSLPVVKFSTCDNDLCCVNNMIVKRDECDNLQFYDWIYPFNAVGDFGGFNSQYTRPCPNCRGGTCIDCCDKDFMRTYLYYEYNPNIFWGDTHGGTD